MRNERTVERAKKVVERWQAELAEARGALADLDTRAGAELLDDESAARRIPKLKAELWDRIDVAERALAEAEPRLERARRDVLRQEAATYEPLIVEQQKQLAEHDARTQALLEALQSHSGALYRPVTFDDPDLRNRAEQGERVSLPVPVRQRFVDEVERLTRRRDILLAVADGQDPRQVVGAGGLFAVANPPAPQEYPASVWGPDAVIPAPAYLHAAGREVVAG